MINPNNQIREDVEVDLRVIVVVNTNKRLQDTPSLSKSHEIPSHTDPLYVIDAVRRDISLVVPECAQTF
jgi:hypothetical protein